MERIRWREIDGLVKLAAVIASWDVLRWRRGKETFSVQWGRLLLTHWRALCIMVWVALTHHLFCNLLPKWARKTWRMPCRSVSK